MPVVVTAADRASFNRCRRQWDLGAGMRQDLEPIRRPAMPDLDRAVRDALAVYYFPGMWDWDRGVRLPLVGQELERALARQRQRADADADSGNDSGNDASRDAGDDAEARARPEALDQGHALLARYLEWTPRADRFAPVLVETDFEVNVLDPAEPDAALVAGGGEPVRYTGRIDMMAVDEHDAYWIVRHRVVDGDWPSTEQLVADEESLAACWAWEQFYLGMAIAGTIFNELRLLPAPESPPQADQRQQQRQPGHLQKRQPGHLQKRQPGRWRMRWPWRQPRPPAELPAVRQHEPSGGGRSIPQHRRMYARAREPWRVEPIEQLDEDGFRRIWLRRRPADVAAAGRRLGADVAEMIRPGLAVYPEPSDDKCPPCPFLDPCRAMQAGRDAEPILRTGYRTRLPVPPEEGRLGGRAWSLGRGAAPPRFRPRGDG
jgi:hypothetical protein